MAVFRDPIQPIEGISTYFFNDSYEAKFVQEHAREYFSHSYYRCLQSQVEGCGLGFTSGSMKEFKLDYDFNRTCGFPHRTYSLHIDNTYLHDFVKTAGLVTDPKDWRTFSILPDYSNSADFYEDVGRSEEEKKYSTRLGDHLYSMWDTFTMADRFKYALLFFVGDKLFANIRIVPCKQYTYFCIFPEESEIGIPEDYITNLVANNGTWSIYLQRQSAFYFHQGLVADFISEKGIDLSQFTGKFDTKYAKSRLLKANGYHLFISSVTAETPLTLLDMSYTSKVVTDDKVYFEISYDYYYALLNLEDPITVVAINVDQIYMSAYLGLNRAFSVPIDDKLESEDGKTVMVKCTPTPPENIRVYAISPQTGIKRPLPNAILDLYYPNVYEIEADSISPSETVQVDVYNAENGSIFYNPISDYIAYCDASDETYAERVINDTLPEALKNYVPKMIRYSIADYLRYADYSVSGALVNQPDEYPLAKIIEMMEDNPTIAYDLFVDVRKELNDHDVLEYDIRLAERPDIYEREVMDTSQFTVGDEDAPNRKFTSPNIWIAINSTSVEGYPFQLYLDGKLYASPYIYRRGTRAYTFIPKTLITDHSILHITLMLQDQDKEFATAEPITFNVLNETQEFPFPFNHFSARNLIFWDKETRIRYPANYFEFHVYYNMTSAYIKTYTIELGHRSEDKFLMTTEENGEHLFVVTGPGSSVMSSLATFYRNINTRIARHSFSLLANPDILENTVMNNYDQIKAPQYQTEFDEEMIWFALEAPRTYGFIYPSRVMISTAANLDDEFTDNFSCYSEMDEKGVTRMYVYIPKSLVDMPDGASVSYDVILAPVDVLMHRLINYNTAPEIRISCNNAEAIGKPIMIRSVDTYKSAIWDTAISTRDYYDWASFHYDANTDRFRVWSIDTNYVGMLMSPNDYSFEFGLHYGDSVTLRLREGLTPTGRYYIEYLPHRVHTVYTFDNTREGLIGAEPRETLDTGNYTARPLSFVNYEFFQNGVRMDANMLSFPTEHKIHYKDEYLREGIMTVQERNHDADIWDNSQGLPRSLQDKIYDEDEGFAQYLRDKHDAVYEN